MNKRKKVAWAKHRKRGAKLKEKQRATKTPAARPAAAAAS